MMMKNIYIFSQQGDSKKKKIKIKNYHYIIIVQSIMTNSISFSFFHRTKKKDS